MRYVLTFSILFIHWIVWSGIFDAYHLSLGVISCGIVTYTSHSLLFERKEFRAVHITEVIRFVKYLCWLFYQIILANIHVMRISLSPRMLDLIDPQIIRFKTKLKKDISLVTFGNSITLTPGTITMVVEEGYYYVHALDTKVAEGLPGEMEDRVAHIFMEDRNG
ncbi:MAG: Na+/H+ antiporter subunit E [Nitrospirae bacterium]|nr:Na+/H+ antiporter subunit E [Nitrospirota bacterium]